ncbi:hypothetical protein SCP_0502990 [Sparassis crispa]|uniref:F-box domain-containing protein n=1 Tax=Sparassis crispa TaxID=139825 RepID=A0A401GM05_9APHY|nr:hypothetical protein SCP_0502990 [Sparassis crispa]GBE83251.1 hypothetical protein SCP_0502990 [Sparassis crispa]
MAVIMCSATCCCETGRTHQPVVVLPPEIFDHIIDFLWDDPSALAACSLTCRTWLPTTRLHLFRSVTLGGAHHCAQLNALLDASAAASTGIPRYIRELCILTPWMDEHGHLNHLGQGLTLLLPRLRAVQHLALANVLWNPSFSPTTKQEEECFLTFSPAVRTLRLSFVDFENPHDLLRFLSAYPQLRTVHMSNVSWGSNAGLGAPSPVVVPELGAGEKAIRIEDLTIVDTGQFQTAVEAMASLFLSPRFDLRLRRLHWGVYAFASRGPGFKNVLRRAGTHLEELQIALYSLDTDAALPDDVTLAHNTRLASLHIVSNTFAGVRCPWVPALLSTIASPRLSQIIFTFLGTVGVDWAHVDESLSHLPRTLPRLVVTFGIHGGETVDAIRSSLPRLSARGTRLDISVC